VSAPELVTDSASLILAGIFTVVACAVVSGLVELLRRITGWPRPQDRPDRRAR
jgi:hypothetical protein